MAATLAVFANTLALQAQPSQTQPSQTQPPTRFTLPAQPLADALRAIGTQTSTNVVFDPTLMEGRQAPALDARLSLDEALSRLLKGTGMTYRFLNERTVVIRGSVKKSARTDIDPFCVAKHSDQSVSILPSTTSKTSALFEEDSNGKVAEELSSNKVEEVVVTGTHIHGGSSIGQQLIIVTGDEVRQSGYLTVHGAIRSLPQSFNGGVSQDTAPSDSSVQNPERGTALDLRGLGHGTTLVLVNGRRITPAGFNGNFTDVSSIPLTAVERIEILPDGASAIYGADAVGGVVNIILKNRMEGADTTAQFGTVTERSRSEYRLGQTLGFSWKSGTALAAAEYYSATPLSAAERSQASADRRPFGGTDTRRSFCNPGIIVVDGQTYAIPRGQNGSSLESPIGDQ